MKVTQIDIKNYRSIKDEISIPIKKIGGKTCFVFLGINECGKSNILKAISLFDQSAKFEYSRDCNKDAKKENQKIQVKYHVILESETYKDKLKGKGVPDTLIEHIKVTDVERKISIGKDGRNSESDFYHIWIKENESFSNYVIKGSSEFLAISQLDVDLSGEELTPESIKTKLGQEYEIVDKEKIEDYLQVTLKSYLDAIFPRIVFWEPKPEYLITSVIDLNSFKDDTKQSIPLQNIFSIAGIEKIKERVELALSDVDERSELEKTLGKSITDHINDKWPEHAVNIKVRIENTQCTISVEDKDKEDKFFNLAERSEGARHFISILLNISAENESGKLKNKIIVIDEPEIHLHPGGVKSLREELLKISEKNIVFLSTHSPYMIDKLNLERHYKVDKNECVTSLTSIEKNNPYQEDVIYEALGTSIYEFVVPNVLIFEGKTDKDVFDYFTTKFTNLERTSIDSISADSADKVPIYTKFFNQKRCKGFILLDSDKKGQKIRREIVDNHEGYNDQNTFEINDIKNTKKESTLEDLLPVNLIKEIVNSLYGITVTVDTKKPIIDQIIKQLKDAFKIGNSQKDEAENKIKVEILNALKSDLKNLSEEELKKKYKLYIDFASKLIAKVK